MEKLYSLAQFDFIMQKHKNFTAREMATKLNLPIHVITGIGYRYGIEFKRVNRKLKENPEDALRHHVPASLQPDPPPAKITTRPSAEYSNSGYLQTAKTYGL